MLAKTAVIAVPAAVLGILTVLGSGCSSKKEAPKEETPPAAAEAEAPPREAPAAPKKAAPVFEGPGALLPKRVGEFALSANPRYFGPDNLYDLINGGAEIYTEFGLVKMVTADFAAPSKAGITVTVEIYDMGTPQNAFGRFARFLKGKTELADVGKGLPEPLRPFGLMGTSNATFWKGRHLVNLTLMDESASATMASIAKVSNEVLPGFADAVAGQIPGEMALPDELSKFPKEDLIPRSERFEARKLAGVEGLGAGFTADYKVKDASFTLFMTGATEDTGPLLAALEKSAKDSETTPRRALAQGNHVVGFVATSGGWTPKDDKQAMSKVKALQAALGK
jgi:hypothetical protein